MKIVNGVTSSNDGTPDFQNKQTRECFILPIYEYAPPAALRKL
jgi:hypothetical protein